MKIISYADKETERFDLTGKIIKGCKWASVESIVRRKLDILIHASEIIDLMSPPNNKFKWLKGNLTGYASIRVNAQWRIIFKVNNSRQLEQVQVTDYH